MRGDSVRDLYAKALALIGLAVLAGAGALMDYWPVQGSLPLVSFNFSLPAGPGALAARVALASPVASPVAAPLARPRVTAPVAVAAPLPVPVEAPIVTVPADETLAPPATGGQPVEPTPAPTAAVPAADPVPMIVAAVEPPLPTLSEPMAAPRVSHREDEAPAPSGNLLQRAGGQVLNAGFAVGTGVAKSFTAFGTAFSNIGKLFTNK